MLWCNKISRSPKLYIDVGPCDCLYLSMCTQYSVEYLLSVILICCVATEDETSATGCALWAPSGSSGSTLLG